MFYESWIYIAYRMFRTMSNFCLFCSNIMPLVFLSKSVSRKVLFELLGVWHFQKYQIVVNPTSSLFYVIYL